ncbi:MAG: hypothetical protein CVU55_01340 [Deltaproteobacteria bacterium HGW-Deltaproteobacteria-13]|jgi:hypothetical protein|nr:MAG: hypothetical protein CVU55_01340 [Deltaproteobacteria bacterium HGW-Deltaproteobacteria-13]
MHDPDKSEVENDCKELLKAFKGVLSWQWDSRFETVLAEFRADNKDSIRTILDRYLSNAWNSSNIGTAPDIVQNIGNRLGKLRAGQLLLTSDPNREIFIYCAWWPWGNGKDISIRIAPCYKKLSDSEKADKIKQFRNWFEI